MTTQSGFLWPVGEPESERHGVGLPAGWVVTNGFQNEYRLSPNGVTGPVQVHPGIDILMPNDVEFGARVYAVAAGTVRYSGMASGSWGRVVLIEHAGGIWSQYAHLSVSQGRPGDVVGQGWKVGNVGDAEGRFSPHLHFELRRKNIGATAWPQSIYPGDVAAQHKFVAENYLDPIGVLGA